MDSEEQEVFNQYLSDVYTGIPPDTLLFQGQDLNASLGCHQEGDGFHEVLGQHGLARRDEKGKEFLDLLQAHNLRAAKIGRAHV